MKILQITSTPVFYPGGMEKVIWEISKRLARENDVTILQTNLYVKDYKKFEKREGVNIVTCKNDFFLFGYGYSSEFKKKLKEIYDDFDVVHIHGFGRFTSDFSLRFLNGKKPMIFTAHGFFHTRKMNFFKELNKLFMKRWLSNVRFVTALTKVDFLEYNKLGIENNKIVEIPNGVDLSGFKIAKKKGRNILFVGRIHESKGLKFLVQAIKDIDCKITIVGKDAGYRRKLEELIEENGMNRKVVFAGEVGNSELRDFYFNSDLFVLVSEHEGFGIVVIEAMASGLPVVVSDKGSLPYLVEDGISGY